MTTYDKAGSPDFASDLDAPRDTDIAPARLHDELIKTWGDKPGLWGWLTTIDHKRIGIRYIMTAFVFLLLGGILAAVIRLQLSRPDNHLVSSDQYNQIFTTHGATMMFLFTVPMMEGLAIYLVPLMVGSRNIAFPRLNAFSYWIYLFGGIMVWVAFMLNAGPDAGWSSYVPLAGPKYGNGKRSDVWAQMITFTEISALAGAVELIVTILKQRAPGMSLNRIPVYVWSILVMAFVIVFALPSVVLGSSMLMSDRLVGTHFFNPAEGGDSLLWQHLFWFFGHPEVYIVFIPAVGIASTIVETAARRTLFGYTVVVMAIAATGFLSFGLWVHHMFATGLPRLGNSFFTASSMAIAIPSGLEIFCWIATLWDGKVRVRTSLLFVYAFIIIFVLGGMTGLMISSVPFDLQATHTYFIVGHIHYVLMGGMMAPLLGGFYHWFPKFTGRTMNETAGRWHFWMYLVGVNLTFFPMLVLGLRGMTRRIYTYQDDLGWNDLNLAASIGSAIIVLSFVIFIGNVLVSLKRGPRAERNPWGASSLEWSTPILAPAYNFLYTPFVGSVVPLWDRPDEQPVVTGLRVDRRELLTTTSIDAEPDLRDALPAPSLWPLLAAIAMTGVFVCSMFSPWALSWGAIPIGITLTGWLYPRADKGRKDVERLPREVMP